MKSFKKFSYLTCLLLFILPLNGVSQNIKAKPSDQELIDVAREMIIESGICALITLDKEGCPRVRMMDSLIPDSDFTFWFGTNPKSRKVNQIRKDPRVSLYYQDPDDSGYLMIQGIAQLVNDPAEKEKHWKDEWEEFYPNKAEDFLLIKVLPQWMEVISYAYNILGDSITWEAPKVVFD